MELFKLPDPDQNPERLRPALLTPWGTTDDEPPIGEMRFGKNRITFSQCRMSLGDLGCSKCNWSGSGCTTCRLKLGWVPADSTKKHWAPDTTKIGSAQAENKSKYEGKFGTVTDITAKCVRLTIDGTETGSVPWDSISKD